MPNIRLREPNPVLSRFGDRVRHYRERASLTQAQLAAAIGISRSSVANMEAGRQEPGLDLLTRLAGRLGTSADTLTTGKPLPETTLFSERDRYTAHLDATQRHYQQQADRAWAEHAYLDAIRFRAAADALTLAAQIYSNTVNGADPNHWSGWTTSAPPYTSDGCGLPPCGMKVAPAGLEPALPD